MKRSAGSSGFIGKSSSAEQAARMMELSIFGMVERRESRLLRLAMSRAAAGLVVVAVDTPDVVDVLAAPLKLAILKHKQINN